jgi:DNA polymerase I-like protein with 3'-5' exonuclease and polymerase domains
MKIILDIEANGLRPDTIWVIVAKEIGNDGTNSVFLADEIGRFGDWCRDNDVSCIIGHNVLGYDIPVMERLIPNFKWEGEVEDTLVMSRLANPQREGGHSLASWGDRLLFPKGEHSEWDKFSWEMVEYCQRDVDVTLKTYEQLKIELDGFSSESVKLEHDIARIIHEQVENGWTLDERKANLLLGELRQKLFITEQKVRETFKPLPVFVELVYPGDKKYNKDGSISKRYQNQLDKGAHFNSKKEWGYITYPLFNLGSRQQIGRYLQHFGWKPKQFTDKGSVIVNEAVLTSVNIPEAKMIAEYLMLQKRVAQVQSWVDAVEIDGRVHGYVNPIGAVTGRMTHSKPNLAQVPASYSPYGKECREVWVVPKGKCLVGMDASGLELRMLAHYMNDEEYTNEVIHGDIHTANQMAAGLQSRDSAKTFIYAFLYGAGDEKIGSIVDGSRADGKQLKAKFLDNTPSLRTLRERVGTASKRGYLKGLDGRKIWVRSKHSALNTLLQGAGAIVMKKALTILEKSAIIEDIGYKFIGNIHDEIQTEVNDEQATIFGELAVKSIQQAGEELNLHCPLDGEYKIGGSWNETH